MRPSEVLGHTCFHTFPTAIRHRANSKHALLFTTYLQNLKSLDCILFQDANWRISITLHTLLLTKNQLWATKDPWHFCQSFEFAQSLRMRACICPFGILNLLLWQPKIWFVSLFFHARTYDCEKKSHFLCLKWIVCVLVNKFTFCLFKFGTQGLGYHSIAHLNYYMVIRWVCGHIAYAFSIVTDH